MVYFSPGSREDDTIAEKISGIAKKERERSREEEKPADAAEEEFNEFAEEEPAENDAHSRKEKKGKKEHSTSREKEIFKKKGGRLKKVSLTLAAIALVLGAAVLYKTTNLFSKISTANGSIFGGMFKDTEDVGGVKEGRVNVLLIGMRGLNIPGGSLLADSIMVISIKPDENKVAMISIPRDLYVEIPGKGYSRKINEANPIGEEEGKGKGLELMKQTVSNVTGLPIHYAISANFDALRDTVDVLGGVTVHLDKPFLEGKQFVEGNECGGEFSLPAGDVQLSGEKALCYSRARYATSDFDRAKRQQAVLLAIKDKGLSAGTLTDFNKVNGLLNVVGDNIRTDMEPWEMQEIYGLMRSMDKPVVYHKVFDTSEEGLLHSSSNGSYILLPSAGNYDAIQQSCRDIFNDPPKQ